MIQLHQYPRLMGMPNASPFCLKLESWLKLAEIPYDIHEIGDPRGAPKQKLPYITDDGQDIADTAIIIDYLKKKYPIKLDAFLSAEQEAVCHAVGVMLEEHLYWCIIYFRWQGENWPKLRKHFFAAMPPLVNKIVPNMIQKRILADLYAQGMGRHSEEEVARFAANDLTAIKNLLGDNYYLMGDQPCSVDATLFAFLSNIVNAPLASPMKGFIQRSPTLMAYNQRMGSQLFPDFFE